MRILHIYKDYYPVVGGIENHIKMLAEAQARRGHEVAVLVTSRDARTRVEMRNGVRVLYAARLASISSTPISAAFPGLLAAERPDVAHLHFPYPPGEISNLLLGRARKTVLTYHSDIVRQKYLRVLYRPLMERVLGRADRIIATSPNYISSSPVLARWRDKCSVVPLGIDPAPFLSAPATASLQTQDSGQPLFTLLFVGHLRYYKGLDYLLQALQDVPRARLVVVGTGPMERAWRNLALELNMAKRVEFAGQVPDAVLPAYYAATEVFVLPACERSEAFGLVQLEAMASGRPVVSCDVGTGVAWVNRNEVTGLVVPPRNPAALAAAVNRLLADAPLRERMGQAGRARVLAGFAADRMVDRIL
ncbi:MAG: glycosyltransferase, partial [Rudaea sp.]